MKQNHLDIIDPIHDFVRTYGVEIKIIDNPIFQRLRRIRLTLIVCIHQKAV